MTTYTGQLGSISLGVNPIAEIRGFEISATADNVDDTVMGDTWRTQKTTFKSWSGSMDVLYDNTNTLGQDALTVGSDLSASFHPSGDTAGHGELTGTIKVTERTIKSSHEGLVEMSVSFVGNGALVETDAV